MSFLCETKNYIQICRLTHRSVPGKMCRDSKFFPEQKTAIVTLPGLHIITDNKCKFCSSDDLHLLTFLARKCRDYEDNSYNLGESWINMYGRFTCTSAGVEYEQGCQSQDRKDIVPIDTNVVMTHDDGVYK